ncbi:hypothetical protein ACLIKD_06730 [Azonexus sp. IMCC34842]|uniref:hypothetical protein n=1 Tax=Azonexus sp. IMCC34842 TaxID=3420950 RepID=UPI003D137BF9
MTSKARIAAINAIADEFLVFVRRDKLPSPTELEARYNRVKAAVESCDGGLDGWSVASLFCLLEEKAWKEIANLAALAQTTEPDRLRKFEVSVAPVSSVKDGKFVVEAQSTEQRELPERLIAKAVALKKHNQQQGKAESVNSAREKTVAAKNGKEFFEWTKQDHVKDALPKNVNSIKEIAGFKTTWGKDDTIKRWWKDAFPDHKFSSGREKNS